MDGSDADALGGARWSRGLGTGLIVAGAVVAGVAIVLGAILLIAGGSSGPRPASPRAPAAPTPAPAAERFGVSVNRLFNDGIYTAQQIEGQLAALRATGATIARSDALWEATEPTPPVGGTHRYVWGFDDAIAAALARHGLRWLPIIDYAAPWDESVAGSDHSAPRSAGDYAAYAAAFAARYGPGGSFWAARRDLAAQPVDTFEIWNEPDSPHFWQPSPDARRYADLYRATRSAILATDPGARVIVGGLSNPGAFLPALIAAAPDLRGHIDGVGIHPYAPSPGRVMSTVARARATLAALGMGSVPLYVTEVGWPTRPPRAQDWAPESLRPSYIQSTIAALGHINCDVAMTVLYTWVTPERDPADREDWFGIQSPAGAGTPDTQALTAGLRAAAAPGPQVDACPA